MASAQRCPRIPTLLCIVLNNVNEVQPPWSILYGARYFSGRMQDSQSRELVFESPLLPFRIWGICRIFVLSTTPQFSGLYKWVPGFRRWWKCERIVLARNCCAARMLPREVELVSEWTGLPGREGGGGVKYKALWAIQRTQTLTG